MNVKHELYPISVRELTYERKSRLGDDETDIFTQSVN
jgi:hypothetical protein